jgi:NAD(P)-dependent dehydrogenase (short-subunit alcohol dehydrogenase family)
LFFGQEFAHRDALTDNVVLVTGGSGGLAGFLAKILARQ